jgi:Fur family peroxide stress response transcriptional regulator
LTADYSHIVDLLKKHGLKVTQQRLVVYQCLQEMSNHPTAEQVFDIVKASNPSISLATVYKTLDTMTEVGLINRVSSPGGHKRYDSELIQHNHLYVRDTNEIYDFHDKELHDLIVDYLGKKRIGNFNLKNFRLHLEGEKIDPEKDISIN